MSDISGTDAASDLLSMMCFDGGFVTIDSREVFLWQQGMKLLVDEVTQDSRGFQVRGQLTVSPIPEFMQPDTRTGWYFQMGDDVQWELGDKVDLPDDPAPNDLPYDPDPDPEPVGWTDNGSDSDPWVDDPDRRRPNRPIGRQAVMNASGETVAKARVVSITLRLSPGLAERLTDAAQERVVGRNLLIQRLLERALDNLPPVSL